VAKQTVLSAPSSRSHVTSSSVIWRSVWQVFGYTLHKVSVILWTPTPQLSQLADPLGMTSYL